MANRAIDGILGMIVMVLFLPIFAVMDEAIFASFVQLDELPLGAMLVAVIILIEVVGYLRFFGDAINRILS